MGASKASVLYIYIDNNNNIIIIIIIIIIIENSSSSPPFIYLFIFILDKMCL